jgi:hypothetical protein
LKSVTVGDRKLYVFPTLKGLVSEGEEVVEAYDLIRPDVVCVSLSDRELAEVRMVVRQEDGHEVEEDYVPESEGMREKLGVGHGHGEGDDEEVEVPAGVASRADVEEAMDEPFHPDLMAADSAARGDQIFVSDSDMAYSQKLATFGEVELPPPAFVEAVRRADGEAVPVVDIDLTDDEYTEVFVDHVTYWQLVSHSRKVKRMRKRLDPNTPVQMAEQWDAGIRSVKGLNVVESERERKMAISLEEQLERHDKVLAVIDHVRVEGTLDQLASLLKERGTPPG